MASFPLRVLLILIEPPLPFGNAGSRWFHVLYQQLLDRGHDVHVLVASGSERDLAKAKEVFKDPRYKIQFFPFGKSRYFFDKIINLVFPHKIKFSGEFKKAFHNLQKKSFDIIHVEQTWAGWVAFPHAEKTLLNVHFLQNIDLAHAKPSSWLQSILYRRWFETEKYIISRYPYVRTCTSRLEEKIKTWGQKKIIKTIPFGIDPTLYPYIESSQRQIEAPVISLIGNMGWYPSASAAKRLLEKLWLPIKEQIPQARCQIVGWSARTVLKDYLHLQDVEIVENVPDIQPYFNQASLLLYAPQKGSGMKIKVQEAMLFGVPVVTTSEGAEGLPAQDMVHCGLCDDDHGLIQRTVEILKSKHLQESLREKARTLILEHCSPKKTVDEIETFYREIIQQQ